MSVKPTIMDVIYMLPGKGVAELSSLSPDGGIGYRFTDVRPSSPREGGLQVVPMSAIVNGKHVDTFAIGHARQTQELGGHRGSGKSVWVVLDEESGHALRQGRLESEGLLNLLKETSTSIPDRFTPMPAGVQLTHEGLIELGKEHKSGFIEKLVASGFNVAAPQSFSVPEQISYRSFSSIDHYRWCMTPEGASIDAMVNELERASLNIFSPVMQIEQFTRHNSARHMRPEVIAQVAQAIDSWNEKLGQLRAKGLIGDSVKPEYYPYIESDLLEALGTANKYIGEIGTHIKSLRERFAEMEPPRKSRFWGGGLTEEGMAVEKLQEALAAFSVPTIDADTVAMVERGMTTTIEEMASTPLAQLPPKKIPDALPEPHPLETLPHLDSSPGPQGELFAGGTGQVHSTAHLDEAGEVHSAHLTGGTEHPSLFDEHAEPQTDTASIEHASSTSKTPKEPEPKTQSFTDTLLRTEEGELHFGKVAAVSVGAVAAAAALYYAMKKDDKTLPDSEPMRG